MDKLENHIEFGDNRETMKRWAQQGVKVQMCVTSPPYYGLRDYGTATWVGGDPECNHYRDNQISESCSTGHTNLTGGVGDSIYKKVCKKCGAVRQDRQLGLEDTPEEYVENMVDVFRHVRDILADDGVLWVNIGDSYYNYVGNSDAFPKQSVSKTMQDLPGYSPSRNNRIEGLKNKDLIGIPWMLALALRKDGWYLRQDIIWHKPNPMPESVRDRCTKAHEYIFLLSKNSHYFFDHEAIKEPTTDGSGSTRNKRDVWSVNVSPYKGAHFAVFPRELIEPCIKAGSRKDDVVFDPFMGSGTTAAVALSLDRKYLGCELNNNYHDLQRERLVVEEKLQADRNIFNDLFSQETDSTST